MNSMMAYLPNPPPVARSPRAVMFRARMVLVSIAVVAALLLVAVASWPLKLLVVLAFVRGLLAADVVAFRNVPRVQRGWHPTTGTTMDPVSGSAGPSAAVRHHPSWPSGSASDPTPHVVRAASHVAHEHSDATRDTSRPDGWLDSGSGAISVDLVDYDDYRNAGSSP